MRFKEFLTETEHYPSIERDDWINSVKTECSEFLEINKAALLQGRYLYRGIADEIPLYFSGTPRKDRRPLDTNKNLHKALDEYFLKKFGFRYRSNGLFSCRTLIDARRYSGSSKSTAMIFPTNDYTMCSSDDIQDIYKDLKPRRFIQKHFGEIGKTLDEMIEYIKRIEHGIETDFELMDKIMDTFDYFENKMLVKHYNTSEIMVKCDKFYGYALIGNGMSPYTIRELFETKEQNYETP